MHRIKRSCLPLLLGLLAVLGLASALPAAEASQEYQLKAAFLVNFAKFITWPEEAFPPGRQEFVLCVAGEDPFGATLDTARSKTIANRSIRVELVDSIDKASGCHLLFVSRSEQGRLNQLKAGPGKDAVLTVSDIEGFVQAGGMIEFIARNDRLAFLISHTAMKRRALHASASLLDLAVGVE